MFGKKDKPAERQGFIKRLRARLNRGDSWLTYDLANLAPGGKIDEDVLEDPAIDFVVRGEGEETFIELMDGLRDGRTDWSECPGITCRDASGATLRNPDRPPPAELDGLPFPAWDLIDHEKYHSVPRGGVIYAHKQFATMFSSRACPWRCTYCHNSYGKTFRERSAENVLAEIDYLKEGIDAVAMGPMSADELESVRDAWSTYQQ